MHHSKQLSRGSCQRTNGALLPVTSFCMLLQTQSACLQVLTNFSRSYNTIVALDKALDLARLEAALLAEAEVVEVATRPQAGIMAARVVRPEPAPIRGSPRSRSWGTQFAHMTL